MKAVDTEEYHKAVERCIPATFHMISAADDSQEAQEAFSTSKFELPNPNGKEGGCCTSALLQVFYDNAHKIGTPKLSWVSVLTQMRAELKSMGYVQEPQLSSSRRIEPTAPLHLVPPGSGRRRALLIGINYVGQKGELRAPHNDCNNVKDYLMNVCGFADDQMLVLMDDGNHPMPTRANIEAGFERLCKYSQPGDVVFVSFSGHGGRTEDLDGDESDGYDESIIPVDFQEAGQIVDDDILLKLVKSMPEGVHCTLLMDCCHSGTVADLPYKMGADDKQMQLESGFNTETAEEILARKAAQEKGDLGPERPKKDYHPDPLPYRPQDGIPVRRANTVQSPPPPPPRRCVIM